MSVKWGPLVPISFFLISCDNSLAELRQSSAAGINGICVTSLEGYWVRKLTVKPKVIRDQLPKRNTELLSMRSIVWAIYVTQTAIVLQLLASTLDPIISVHGLQVRDFEKHIPSEHSSCCDSRKVQFFHRNASFDIQIVNFAELFSRCPITEKNNENKSKNTNASYVYIRSTATHLCALDAADLMVMKCILWEIPSNVVVLCMDFGW
jgi:hypothetical protein